MSDTNQAWSTEIDETNGQVIIRMNKGIIGAAGNQFKATSDKRKGASILRALGHELAAIGDILYKQPQLEEECEQSTNNQ